MAPEQIRRWRGQPSVDIYALGAMLYEMLTGHPPFEGDDPFVVASARQIGDPKAPRELCSTISEEAEEIVLRGPAPRSAFRSATRPPAQLKAPTVDHPSLVRVSGLAARLVEVTPWRLRLRWMRFIALVGVTPIALLVALFGVLWWWLARKH